MKPEVSVLPLAGNLKYQEKLAFSPFTGGEVTYKENKVTGASAGMNRSLCHCRRR